VKELLRASNRPPADISQYEERSDVTSHDDDKKQKENIQRAVEDLVQTTSKHPPDSPEVEAAKTRRALAEKELVDSRDADSPHKG
jgi:hypothetical protein